MRHRFIIAIALAAITSGSLWAQTTRSAEVQFKAAQEKEEVIGDLKGAIKDYEKIANGKDRALAAEALLRMAKIHRLLGDAEANKFYQRVIREFADQTAAVSVARASLSDGTTARSTGAGMGRRFIPVPELKGILVVGTSVSSDGRYIAYIHSTPSGGRAVVVRDLTTGLTRTVSPTTTAGARADLPMYPVFSPDGRRLAYTWASEQSWDLRVADLQEPGVPRVRKLLGDRYVQPFDWTPDGKSIVVAMTHLTDKTADFSLVSASDGSRRVLTPVDGEQWSSAFVSPDGKYLARDHRASTTESQWDVFVLPIDGGPEIRVVEHPAEDRLVGWSPDGRHLLFTSDRNTGTPGLYALPMVNGRPQGTRPILITASIGTLAPVHAGILPLRVTKGGALYYAASDPAELTEIQEIEITTFDLETGVLGNPTLVGADRGGQNTAPAWSPDGRYLAYRSVPVQSSRELPSVMIRSDETGKTRELHPGLAGLERLQWSPDGRFILTSSAATQNPGVHRIDVQTGEASPVVLGPGKTSPIWSPDGARILYRQVDGQPNAGTQTVAYIERELASGKEREIIRRPALGALSPSPDGRYIATGADDAAADTRTILLIPTSGGEPRTLRVNRPRDGGVQLWAPDGRSVLVRSSAKELWRLPIEGEPVRLSNDLPPASAPVLHRDGRRIARVQRSTPTGNSQFQTGVWVLENFLPRPESPATSR